MTERVRNRWLAAAELALALVIVGLLVATWLPTILSP